MRLIHWLLHRPTWQKLPPIPRQLSSLYDEVGIEHDTQRLMQLTHVRCPQYVALLLRRHKVETARELVYLLPPRRRPRMLKKRLLALARRAFGLSGSDPMRKIAAEYKYRHGYRRAP